MDISFLSTVLAVVENKTFSAAAASIPCSQSSVSRQIARVEAELGTPIFEHIRGGKIELTPYGKSVLPQIRQIVENYNQMQAASRIAVDPNNKKFRMLVFKGPFNSKIQGDFVSELYVSNPNYSVTVSDASREDMLFNLQSGNADCAVIYDPLMISEFRSIKLPDKVHAIKMFKKYPCIAMAKDHPLAEKESVNFSSLKYETFFFSMKRKKMIQDDYFIESCRREGFMPKIKNFTSDSFSDARDAAVATSGWMYPTFATLCMSNHEKVTLVPVENPIYYAVFYFLYSEMDDAEAGEMARQVAHFLTRDDSSCELLL